MQHLLSDFQGVELPKVQKEFIEQLNNTLDSVIKFPKLALVLNPCFTAHYFYVSGTTDENTVTTKITDGSHAMNGKQSFEAESNAYLLSRRLKYILRDMQLYVLSGTEYVALNSIKFNGKKKLFAKIGNEYYRIAGLTTTNLKY